MKTCFDICRNCEQCGVNLTGPGRAGGYNEALELYFLKPNETLSREQRLWDYQWGNNTTTVTNVCKHCHYFISDPKCFFLSERNVYKNVWRSILKKHIQFCILPSCPYYLEHFLFKGTKEGKKAKCFTVME